MENLAIYGLDNDIAYCEAKGLGKVFNTYAEYTSRETILDGGIGFNPNSGAVYIALENSIQIVSFFGRDAEFLVTDIETDEETFFDTYEDAYTALTAPETTTDAIN